MQSNQLVTEAEMEQYLKKIDAETYEHIQLSVDLYKPQEAFWLAGILDRHVPRLVEILNANPQIECLFLNCNIANHGIRLLAQGLKFIKQLSLDATNFGHENPDSTHDTVIALATSNIRHLRLTRSMLNNEHVDLLVKYSKQTKFDLGNNHYLDQSYRDKATQKARENSMKELETRFLGGSEAKRAKTEADSEHTSPADSPENAAFKKK